MATRRLHTLLNHFLHAKSGSATHPCAQLCTQMQQHMAPMPSIMAKPRAALYDDEVKIKLTNFPSNEKITLHGQFVQKKKEEVVFASCGHYVTDETGSVSVWEKPSTGGTYTGVEGMGIVWSLQPAPGHPPNTRMAINFTDKPTLIRLQTYLGHLELDELYTSASRPHSLAEIQLERWLRFPDVTRIDVVAGNVRGALFLPPGDGPFQGIIDIFGGSGGMIEYRAALLASRGFAALSLPYFLYKDLPKYIQDVTFDYFEEAVQWLSTHPKVYPYGIGITAVSKGVNFAYCMAAYCPQVKSVVAINGPPYPVFADIRYKGKVLCKGSMVHYDLVETTDEGVNIGKCTKFEDNLIPAWLGEAQILMLLSEDDFQCDPRCHQLLLDAIPEEKSSHFQVVRYPEAGHLLEPPYTALCRSAINPAYDMLMIFGGYRKEHAHAQKDSWQRLLHHLRENIPTSQ